MDSIRFLQDLTVVLSTAAAVLLLFRKLGQPPVLGYLAAGMIVGPHTPPFPLISDVHTLETLAEIGVVFLLFALGIEFNLSRLARAGFKSIAAAIVEAALMIACGLGAGALMGWSALESFLLGAVAAVAGTAIVARTLLERAGDRRGWEELVAGVLIAEDIVAVLLIAFLASAGSKASFSAPDLWPTAMRFGILITVLLVTGLIVVPKLLRAAERSGMEEVRTLVIVSICFGVALLTQRLGYSAALGAFLAGAVASMGESTPKLHAVAEPFRDVFGAVFFVSVGMLIDPAWIIQNWKLALALTAGVAFCRFFVNVGALAAVGQAPVPAAQAALAMLPIGEFSFVLAQIAQRDGLTTKPIYPLAVLFCFGTTIASSMLLPRATERRLGRVIPARAERALAAYRAALGRARPAPGVSQIWTLIRPSVIQVAINAAAITALFLLSGQLYDRFAAAQRVPGLAWVVTGIASLPFLIAMIRKTQAVALVLFEGFSTVVRGGPPDITPGHIRALMALCVVLVGWWFLDVGSPLLPEWPQSLAPVGLMAAAVWALWRRMNKLYSMLQASFKESMAGPQSGALSMVMDTLAPEAIELLTFKLEPGGWAVGKTILETNLRAETGATLVQITRSGAPIPSPGPGTRLQAGDDLLLIGAKHQVRQAQQLLQSGK